MSELNRKKDSLLLYSINIEDLVAFVNCVLVTVVAIETSVLFWLAFVYASVCSTIGRLNIISSYNSHSIPKPFPIWLVRLLNHRVRLRLSGHWLVGKLVCFALVLL